MRLSCATSAPPAGRGISPISTRSSPATNSRYDEIRSVDIALIPDYCNRGIGTTLLRELQSEAAAAGQPLRIHVERFNPALRLYERLGFHPIADRGVYLFMEWRAAPETGERVNR